ncbi:cytidine/deoxycytidylate deaminase family protein [Corynebacterium terpenotabidum]|uniref:Cytidine/deoxycytidylate deaminase zinc-binding subunit n=1 Tax=Corynebacterium terpenotabidum Y-11 TaxID=1200352 RepID=S4XBB7_9CORY|nr:deoxycytidylate deaminase [Corynebacterium terpenotabidum]AGP30407.1 cytidine/deoxycytidylate deaminase zinc-binding subunit [Corynebacterium terpenotabidum Y-11]
MTHITETDLRFLRRAIELSEESRQRGRHPFAALVLDAEGVVLSEKGNNSMPPEGDPTQHAELTGDDPENPTFDVPCREVAARGQRAIEIHGPMLEDEAAAPHVGFWRPTEG